MFRYCQKLSVILMTLILTLTSFYSAGRLVLAEETDETTEATETTVPDDGIVTPEERKTDLLNEVHEDAPSISAASYVLYDADSGGFLPRKVRRFRKEDGSPGS